MRRKNQHTMKSFLSTVVAAVMIILSVASLSTTEVLAASKPTLTKTTCDMYEGNSYVLNIKDKIKGSTYKWTTSDKKVATVNGKGVVKGINQGKAVITCKVKAPKKIYILTCKIEVFKSETTTAFPTPSQIPTSTPTTPSETTAQLFQIGDKVVIGNTEITVTKVFTTTEVKAEGNGSSYFSNSGEEFYGITFDVLTKNQPSSGRYWYGISFIESIVTADGVKYNQRNILGEAKKIYPNENNSESVYIPIEKGDAIASIVVSDGNGNTATVMVSAPTATPTTTPSTTPSVDITPTPELDVSYKKGDNVSIGNTEITVTKVFTTTEVKVEGNGSFPSNSGEEYYGITFDILTKNQPDSRRYWYGNSFIKNIVTADGVKYYQTYTFDMEDKIYPNEKNSVTVYISVEQGDVIDSIVVSDGNRSTATVSVR
jgi:hypothetical protein